MAEEEVKETAKQPEQVKEEQNDDGLLECPCCRKRTLQAIPHVNDKALERYLACIVSGTPFTYSYTLFKGTVVATISMLSEADKFKLFQLQKEVQTGRSEEENTALMRRLFCYAYVKELTITVQDKTQTYTPMAAIFDTPAADIPALLFSPDKLSGIPLEVIEQVVTAHMILNNALQASAIDPSFWEGIVLA